MKKLIGSLKCNITKNRSSLQRFLVVLVVGAVAGVGTHFLIAGHAATPYSSSYAANGSRVGGASIVVGGSNSSSNAVEFGAPSVTVSLGTNAHSFNGDFLGFNTSDEGLGGAATWDSQPFVSDIAALGAQNFRIYGGTWSDYINWQTGQYFDTFGTSEPVSGSSTVAVPGASFTLNNYVPFLKGTHSAAVFNVNIMTYCPANDPYPEGANKTCGQPLPANVADYTSGTKNYTNATTPGTCLDPVADSASYDSWGLDFQIEMLKAAQSAGIPIKYVELGNELYDYGTDDDQFFPCPQDYVNKANLWVQTIDQDFPGVQVAITGEDVSYSGKTANCLVANRSGANCTRLELWNQALLNASSVLDPSSNDRVTSMGENAITFHTYYHSQLGVDGSVDNPSELSAMLSTGAQDRYTITSAGDLPLLPTGVKAWITEWNIDSDPTDLVYGSWAQGLSEVTYAMGLAATSQVALTDVHDLVDSGQVWGALFSGTSYTAFGGIATLPSPVPATQQYGMTAGGFALSNLLRTMHGATATTNLSFGTNPDIAGTAVPGLIGQSFVVDGKTNLFFVNLSADNEKVSLGTLSGTYSVLQYATSPTNFITGNDSIPALSSTATTELTIPPYSVSSLVSMSSN
jgi:hypothetical protein